LTIRGITLKNRIAVSPMCQYSSVDGMATDWHLVHLGSRAVGGAALVMVEATSVTAAGRISPEDMGIWGDQHIEPLARLATFIGEQGAVPAIQLAHAGRKACTKRPIDGGGPIVGAGKWQAVAPSAIPFAEGYQTPHALSKAEIETIIAAFVAGAQRAIQAGFQIIEIHSAHGYLLHSFLSPLSNTRSDEFGGALENRLRALLLVTAAVRGVIPDSMPLFVRISASDWAESSGWDLEQSLVLCQQLQARGADLIDCSSGGTLAQAKIPLGPGYQVPFAEKIKKECGILTGAVGLITEPAQADRIIAAGQADLVLLAREMLRDPYWPLHAARALEFDLPWPPQYDRAKK
jgi:2,4-dienoyl-CoA reductase-like NADH-dependent reductase (Old Yellow Enzyme family)